MDDELAATVALIPDLSFAELDHTRQTLDALVAALPADLTGVRVEDRRTPGVDVRIFTPEQRSADLAPAVLDIHGGGFAVGPLALDDGPNADLVRATGAVVVSVDYRLAPEHPYPAAAEDCYAALRWLVAHAEELGADPRRVAVLGDSAGGGLAATTALMARDRGGPPIALQVLIEPELDDRLDTPSMLAGADTVGWDSRQAALSWRYYLGGAPADGYAARAHGRPHRAAAHLPHGQRARLPARRRLGVRAAAAGGGRVDRAALLARHVPRLRHARADRRDLPARHRHPPRGAAQRPRDGGHLNASRHRGRGAVRRRKVAP